MLFNIQNVLISIVNFFSFLFDNLNNLIIALPEYLQYINSTFAMLPSFLVPCLGLFVSISVVNKLIRGV